MCGGWGGRVGVVWNVKPPKQQLNSQPVRCSSEAVTGSFGFAEIEMIFIEIYAPFT